MSALSPAPERWTPPARIRAIAIGLVFYQDALQREFYEEINQALSQVEYLATLENHYVLQGVQGHEMVRVYKAQLADPAAYGQSFEIHEPGQLPMLAYFKPLAELRQAPMTLVPQNLWEIVNQLQQS